jgi:hypothetical protein
MQKKQKQNNDHNHLQLPTVLFDLIFSHLTSKELLLVIEHVCSYWKLASSNGNGWRSIDFPGFNEATYSLDWIRDKLGKRIQHHRIHSVIIPKQIDVTTDVLNFSNNWSGSLRSLDIRGLRPFSNFSVSLSSFTQLLHLSLQGDNRLVISNYPSSLVSLELIEFVCVQTSSLPTTLESLIIERASFRFGSTIAMSFPRLQRCNYDMSRSHCGPSQQLWQSLLNNAPKLVDLTVQLTFCEAINDSWKWPTPLTSVSLGYCTNQSINSLKDCTHLQQLHIHNVDEAFDFMKITTLTNLTHLSLPQDDPNYVPKEWMKLCKLLPKLLIVNGGSVGCLDLFYIANEKKKQKKKQTQRRHAKLKRSFSCWF